MLVSQEPVAVLDEVLAATSRLLTNHRVFATPTSGTEALDFCRRIREAPAAIAPAPTARRWRIFAELVETLGLRGNDIHDALLAATAVDQGAVLATFDRGFRRFGTVEVHVPHEG